MKSEDKKTGDDRVYHILIIDDEENTLESLKHLLEKGEYFKCEATVANSAENGLAQLSKKGFDLVISDYKMPKMDGVSLLGIVREQYPKTLRMLITAYSDMDIAKEAINKAGIHSYIEKPWDNEEVLFTIYESLKRKTERESGNLTAPDTVKDALDALKKLLKNVSVTQDGSRKTHHQMMFEFTSPSDFNRFSFEVRKFDDAHIDDVHMFENKYMMMVSIYPGLYRGWKKLEWGGHEGGLRANERQYGIKGDKKLKDEKGANMTANEKDTDDRVYKVIVVDDEKEVGEALKMTLERFATLRCSVALFRDGKSALSEIAKERFDVIIADYGMPVMMGSELLALAHEKHPETVRIILTGFSDAWMSKKGMEKASVAAHIKKPWDAEELEKTMTAAILAGKA